MKKVISIFTSVILTLAVATPVFAAGSPTTVNVMKTPVSAPPAAVVVKGYTLTPIEQALIATTPEAAVALAACVVVDPVQGVYSAVTAPALIALAKLDILKDAGVAMEIARIKGQGVIIASSSLSYPDGHSGKKTINIKPAGTTPGQKLVILYYLPGDVTPHTIRATVRKDGSIRVKLPIPCSYNIIK